MLGTYRLGYSRTRVGQTVEANTATPLAPFVPGREFVGNIDVGGLNASARRARSTCGSCSR